MHLLGLVVRIALVFGLLAVVLHLLRRTEGFRAARRTGVLQVLGSTRVGKGAALTVVRIGDAEYVLGVTDHTVTLLTPTAGAGTTATEQVEPVQVEAVVPGPATASRPDFAAALGARLGAHLGRTPSAPADTPPTPAAFLRGAWEVARRRPTETTDLSTDAVSAALALVRGDRPVPALSVVPTPVRPAPVPPARVPPAPAPLVVPDGSATPTPRHAARRPAARTDALRDEEHPWTRSCRPTTRSSDPVGRLA